MTNKVLITSKPFDHEGGVANYYRVFFEKFDSDEFELVLSIFGSRTRHFYSRWKTIVFYPLFYFVDYCRFLWRIAVDKKIRIVQVSPSLMTVPLIRDAFIVLGAKLLGRRVIVFYRGWKEKVLDALKSRSAIRWLFRLVYNQADQTLVLASHFKDDLVEMGWDSGSIRVTTTTYDKDEVLPSVDRSGLRPKLLFLGRVSEMKGVGELIDALALLAEKDVDFECTLVGHEDSKGTLKYFSEKVEEHNLGSRIEFAGRLTGVDKFRVYSSSDIYVLPSWTEGCPNSVLEALGSGLFVVSTNVGALRDVVKDGLNGRIVRVRDHKDLADALAWACENIEDIRKLRTEIREDAAAKYEIKIVISEFEDLYSGLLHN